MGCKTPVGDAVLRKALEHESQSDETLGALGRPVLRVASGGTVCVDVSNIGAGPRMVIIKLMFNTKLLNVSLLV